MHARCSILSAAAITLALTAPANAHQVDYPPPHQSDPDVRIDYDVYESRAYNERESWLAECRTRMSRGGSAIEGAAIGGVVGGLAGNRIAGRGNRTEGTIVGAAVGAVAGAAIDSAAERNRERDECEAYLDDYYARQSTGAYGYAAGHHGYAAPYGYAQGGYPYAASAYGYGGGCCGQPMMMVPIRRVTRTDPECNETVEELVDYVDAPVRAAAPVRPTPTKRIYVPRPIADKRVPTK